MNEATLHPAELPVARPWYRRRLWIWPVVLVCLLLVYYLAGMAWLHRIDDDPDFAIESSAPEGGSRSVALTADLVDREINTHRWVANDPFFMPGSMLDNMSNFQQGIVAGLSRFAIELADQIARTRGSSQVDSDLNNAAGLLRYPGTVWIFDLSTSLAPTASSESQYRRAMVALRDYNQRLAAGNAVFETRADNLLATLDRIAADIGSSSAALDQHLAEHSGFGLDFEADDVFYANKGRLYAYYLLLRELGRGLRQGDPGARPDRGLDADAGKLSAGGDAAALGGAERRAGQPVLAQPSRGAGLLPAARAHPVAGNQQHPA